MDGQFRFDPHVGINDVGIEPTYVVIDIGEDPFAYKKLILGLRVKKSDWKSLDAIKRAFAKYIENKYGEYDENKVRINRKSKEYHAYFEGRDIRLYRFVEGVHKKYTPVVEISYIDDKWPRHDWVLLRRGQTISFYVV
jgi:hypothetical protein